MALTPAQKQRRYRDKLKAVARERSEVMEAALIREVERDESLSDRERVVLADRLADAAMGHLRRSQELARLARQVRTGGA